MSRRDAHAIEVDHAVTFMDEYASDIASSWPDPNSVVAWTPDGQVINGDVDCARIQRYDAAREGRHVDEIAIVCSEYRIAQAAGTVVGAIRDCANCTRSQWNPRTLAFRHN